MTSHPNESGAQGSESHSPTEIFINKVEASGYSQNAIETCINNCLEAFKATTQLIPHCLSMGGIHAFPGHITLLSNCADICLTSARFMMTASEFHTETCAACALVCARCADECDHMEGSDDRMKQVAEICRRCAQTCEHMAQQFKEH